MNTLRTGLLGATSLAAASMPTISLAPLAIPDRRLPFDAPAADVVAPIEGRSDFDALYIRDPIDGGAAPVAARSQLSERVLSVWGHYNDSEGEAQRSFVARAQQIRAQRAQADETNDADARKRTIDAQRQLDTEHAHWLNTGVQKTAARLMAAETTGTLLFYAADHADGGVFLPAVVNELGLRVLDGTLRLRVAGVEVCGQEEAYEAIARMIGVQPELSVSYALQTLVQDHIEEHRSELRTALLPIVEDAGELSDGDGDLYADDVPSGGLVRINSKPPLTVEEYARARAARTARREKAKANKRGGKHKRRF